MYKLPDLDKKETVTHSNDIFNQEIHRIESLLNYLPPSLVMDELVRLGTNREEAYLHVCAGVVMFNAKMRANRLPEVVMN